MTGREGAGECFDGIALPDDGGRPMPSNHYSQLRHQRAEHDGRGLRIAHDIKIDVGGEAEFSDGIIEQRLVLPGGHKDSFLSSRLHYRDNRSELESFGACSCHEKVTLFRRTPPHYGRMQWRVHGDCK